MTLLGGSVTQGKDKVNSKEVFIIYVRGAGKMRAGLVTFVLPGRGVCNFPRPGSSFPTPPSHK